MLRRIPVSHPMLGPKEAEYLQAALDQGAISGLFGDSIGQFERGFASYSGCDHGVAVSNGTTALHLAVAALGIGAGDEVLVSSLTNMATCFAALYQGATVRPVDIEPDTLNLDPSLLESLVSERTRAIIAVHLFGHPVDMDGVMAVARRHNLRVIEDCAEAHGATYKGRPVGSIGDVGCFSFYANKIITTGEGGMLTTSDTALAEKARSLRSLAFGDAQKFMHQDIGFNYRMSNLQAALGCAQLDRIEEIIEAKRRIARFYNDGLGGIAQLRLPVEKAYARNVYWMYHVLLEENASTLRHWVMERLADAGIETRECFVPFNLQEIFLRRGWTTADACPIANDASARGFYLPSAPDISDDDLAYVMSHLIEILQVLPRASRYDEHT